MKHLNKTLFSLSSGFVLLTPLSLTSCGQAWGFLNPMSCGSAVAGSDNDPFKDFRVGASSYTDADGQSIPDYLQSNFIIDQAKATSYAYTSPVTKWYQDKDDQEDEKKRIVLPTDQWQRLDDGWKSQANNFSTSVTLYDQTPISEDKDQIRRVFNNNENINKIININLTPTIASAIQSFIAGALQYQRTQINPNEQEDLETAWGLKSQAFTQGYDFKIDGHKEEFYEFEFAYANMHATGKTSAFMRPTGINFNYDEDFFPFPTYTINQTGKKTISTWTKKLLLGPAVESEGNFRFYQLWREGETCLVPSYFTDLRSSQSVTIPYIKASDGGVKEWAYENGHCNQYLFSSVPVLVHLNDFNLEWVNPQKNNSFIPSDYYVTDKDTVVNAVGNSWFHLKDYLPTSECKPTRVSYKFERAEESSPISFRLWDGEDQHWDDRLVEDKDDPIDGNTFVVLLDYVVNEYDDQEYIDEYCDSREIPHDKAEEQLPDGLKPSDLAHANAVSINGISNIFPAYLLSLQDENFFIKANNRTESEEKTPGYIINNKVVNKYKTDLSKLITFNSDDGHKPHARDISNDGKNLLAFLTYMFGKMVGGKPTIDMSFISSEQFK